MDIFTIAEDDIILESDPGRFGGGDSDFDNDFDAFERVLIYGAGPGDARHLFTPLTNDIVGGSEMKKPPTRLSMADKFRFADERVGGGEVEDDLAKLVREESAPAESEAETEPEMSPPDSPNPFSIGVWG